MNFVNILEKEAKRIVPSSSHALIYVDKPENSERAPRMIGNYVPDCYYRDKNILLIGEAKTADDVERKHSLSQYEDYFKEASSFDGDSFIIVSAPWQTKNAIKNHFRRLQKKFQMRVRIFVVCEIGEAEEVE
jgi:hypothetical protein